MSCVTWVPGSDTVAGQQGRPSTTSTASWPTPQTSRSHPGTSYDWAGLAILDAGKRDLPFDEGFPEPQLIGPALGGAMEPLEGARITAINDQHCFMAYPANVTVTPGDVVRLGLSHPCTAFDKWTVIPVLADNGSSGNGSSGTGSSADAGSPADLTVVDLIHTFF